MSSPSDLDLRVLVHQLRAGQPNLGVGKLHALIRQNHPEWTVSSKRIKLLITGLDQDKENPGAEDTDDGEPILSKQAFKRAVAQAANLDPRELANHPLFRPIKGKGRAKTTADLEAHERISKELTIDRPALNSLNGLVCQRIDRGYRQEESWFPLLPEGIDDYHYDNVNWVKLVKHEKGGAALVMEQAKVDSLLGRHAAIFMFFRVLKLAAREDRLGISDEKLAKQLEDMFEIDILPFNKAVEANRFNPPNREFIEYLMGMGPDLIFVAKWCGDHGLHETGELCKHMAHLNGCD